MYTVKRTAQLVGVSEATLRAWDRRHGIGPAARSGAGYRLYDDAAVETLQTMKSLVDQGWPVASAAAEACHRSPGPRDHQAQGGQATRSTGELIAYATSFDTRGLDALLDSRFTQMSFERLVDEWLLPSLDEIGLAWADGRVTVAGEHFVSHAVARRLAASYDAAGESLGGAQVAVGLPQGCRHDLGLLCFATAARRAGIATRYLGADVPLADWEAAATAPGVAGAVLAVPRAEDIEAAVRTVTRLRELAPNLSIAAGGGHQDAMPEGVVRLGHGIGAAARALAAEHLTK